MSVDDEAIALDRAKLEAALARLTVDLGAATMTPAEVDAELASGEVTVRGLLAGIYVNGAPAGRA